MAPPTLPAPATIVTGTGILEILGAVGLLIPLTHKIPVARRITA